MIMRFFYTCSLIEYIGRITKNTRKVIVEYLGKYVDRIYKYADVFHCEPIEKVADDFIVRNHIQDAHMILLQKQNTVCRITGIGT